jgi:hypothetical protein
LNTADEERTRLSDGAAAALWRSEGFSVEAGGDRIGIVEDAVRIPGLKRPAALAVRLGTPGKRVVLVPITEITDVDADAHTVTLREAPVS